MPPSGVVLVQVHAVRQHLLEVTKLDGKVRSQIFAVDLDRTRISLVVTPHLDSSLQDVEVGSSLEV